MLNTVCRRFVSTAIRINLRPQNHSNQIRSFSWTNSRLKDDKLKEKNQDSGSVFGDITEFDESKSDILSRLQAAPTTSEGENEDTSDWAPPTTNKELRDDPEVQALMHPKAKTAIEQLLSPLKRALYEKATKNGQIPYETGALVEHEGKKYKLFLSKEELDVLQPSVYLKSYRIKYSAKKTFVFLRMLRKMDLKEAITQCQFNNKKIARELVPMLKKGIEHSKELGLNPDDLYIQQIWVGKDGSFVKRPDYKSRGRAGKIEHKYVHVRAILRQKSYEIQHKEAAQAKRELRPVWIQLPKRNFIDFPRIQAYKW